MGCVAKKSVQEQVREWQEKQQKLVDPDPEEEGAEKNNQRFCCLVYGRVELKVSDCEKRRGTNSTHYVPVHLGRETYRVPKPKFALCIGCNVWDSLPPQEFINPRTPPQELECALNITNPNESFQKQTVARFGSMKDKAVARKG